MRKASNRGGRVGLESLAAARAERRGRLQEAGEFDATYLHLKKVAA
jgi:hypothetical protein